MYLTVFYIVVLLLILLFDIRQRRILNLLVLPVTLIALIAGLVESHTTFLLALSGAVVGFLFFYVLYWVGTRRYGSAALGFGDVKLAMMLGAILDVQMVLIALSAGMILAGFGALVLLLAKQGNRESTLPYGAFLAVTGILFLLGTYM
jgi:prepilin signal peptidase PulO-like enzyme (type II secretory pathway)